APHDVWQEARGAGEEDPARAAGRQIGQPRFDGESRVDRLVRALRVCAGCGRMMPTGTRIEIIAPSGAHLSLERFDRALERLCERGYELRCSAPREGWQRFGATDEARLEQIHRAARAHDIDAVMITRGGYGMSRLLDRIDWPLVASSAARGVRWIGYSDFTAFQLGLLARAGAASFAGPGVAGDFGVDEP